MTFAEKILQFNQNLSLEGVQLPDASLGGIHHGIPALRR